MWEGESLVLLEPGLRREDEWTWTRGPARFQESPGLALLWLHVPLTRLQRHWEHTVPLQCWAGQEKAGASKHKFNLHVGSNSSDVTECWGPGWLPEAQQLVFANEMRHFQVETISYRKPQNGLNRWALLRHFMIYLQSVFENFVVGHFKVHD